MTAPDPHPVAPPPPAVRFDVRLGSGRDVPFTMTGDDFLLGGAAGCDLRLHGPGLPPVVAHVTRVPEGLSLKVLAAGVPVFVNGVAASPASPVAVRPGDTLHVGPAEIGIALLDGDDFHSVRLIPADDPVDRRLEQVKAEVQWLEQRQAELATETVGRQRDRSAAELAFARRHAELEAEYAARQRDLTDRAAAERRELDRLDAELRRRAEWTASETRTTAEAELLTLDPRLAELGRREDELAAAAEVLTRDREKFRADIVRLEAWQADLNDRERVLDGKSADADRRHRQLVEDVTELEEQVKLADAEQTRLAAEAERLAALHGAVTARAAADADRAARVEAQQAMLAVLRAKLDRREDDLRAEADRVAADRAAILAARADLDAKLADAAALRTELADVRDDHEAKRTALLEQHSLLASTLAEIQRQKDEADAAIAAVKAKEADLDARTAEIAEQAAVLTARTQQVTDLHERIEADRRAVRDRETNAVSAEAARQALQEQLRKRAEDLAARAKDLDRRHESLAADREAVEALRAAAERAAQDAEARKAAADEAAAAKQAELDRERAALADREAALARQIARLKDVGRAVAADRKELLESKTALTVDRGTLEERAAAIDRQFADLRRQAPDLDAAAKETLDRLAAARDLIRGHLAELHAFASQTRAELDAAREHLRAETEAVRADRAAVDQARANHRLAVAEFRQHLLDWQATVQDLKAGLERGESGLDTKRTELAATAAQIAATAEDLARREAELDRERLKVAGQRSEMERHLGEMREWYRRKLRELAAGRAVDESDMPRLAVVPAEPEEPDTNDAKLGAMLTARGLVDEETLAALYAEANRQHRTLRQVLLASGAVTLYQLALIEAGTMDGLMLGRFRVIDRVSSGPREAVYRVFDPARTGGPGRGIYLLRHLAESETADPAKADEYRTRFAAAVAAGHPNLVNAVELAELQGRPAVLAEWVPGVPSADWPAAAAVPGVWLKVLTDAARGLNHAHRSGLVHGRLTAESVLLTPDGTVKVAGVGEPAWLHGPAGFEPTPGADLRALGAAAFGWSQLAKRGGRGKPFPPALTALVRKLETGPEPAMADTVSYDRPYADAGELLRDLAKLADDYPLPADGWEKLLRGIGDAAAEPLRKSA